MMRRTTMVMWLALCACGSKDAPKQESAPAATGEAAVAPKPAEAVPGLDLSGKWECIWNVPGGDGAETWMVMQEGAALRVTLTGHDPGGRYVGSMTGTLQGRNLEITFKYNDGTKGSMKLKASQNGKLLDGDSTRAVGGTVSHYGCSRP